MAAQVLRKHRIKTIKLPSGERVPVFGMGTWHLGENPANHAEEIATLRLGLDLGATLIDTAEMYGDGLAEELVGEAIDGRRDEVFLVTKVLPDNASRRSAAISCENSLRRLGTDRIDLYLLHWRGKVPLNETTGAFIDLQQAGKIRYYGVGNFDLADMHELLPVHGSSEVAADQVLYNLAHRGIEWDLLPWLREWGIPVMAYSPIGHSELVLNPELKSFARRYGMTSAQVALAWLLAKPDVIVIPKTSSRKPRLKENLGALDLRLTKAQLAELDQLFPATGRPLSAGDALIDFSFATDTEIGFEQLHNPVDGTIEAEGVMRLFVGKQISEPILIPKHKSGQQEFCPHLKICRTKNGDLVI